MILIVHRNPSESGRIPIFYEVIMTETGKKERLLKLDKVIERTGLGRSTIYSKIKRGQFPESINLGGNNTAWLESEVDLWIADKINQRNQK